MDRLAWRSRLRRGAAAMAAVAVVPGLVALTPSSAGAQAATPSGVVARAGEVVRVRTPQWEYTGTLLRVAADTAVLRVRGDSTRVLRPLVIRTEIQRGTRRSPARVILWSLAGGALGMGAGAAIGPIVECGGSCDGPGDLEGLAGFILGGGAGTLVGLIGGGMYGASKRIPRWITGSLPTSAP